MSHFQYRIFCESVNLDVVSLSAVALTRQTVNGLMAVELETGVTELHPEKHQILSKGKQPQSNLFAVDKQKRKMHIYACLGGVYLCLGIAMNVFRNIFKLIRFGFRVSMAA